MSICAWWPHRRPCWTPRVRCELLGEVRATGTGATLVRSAAAFLRRARCRTWRGRVPVRCTNGRAPQGGGGARTRSGERRDRKGFRPRSSVLEIGRRRAWWGWEACGGGAGTVPGRQRRWGQGLRSGRWGRGLRSRRSGRGSRAEEESSVGRRWGHAPWEAAGVSKVGRAGGGKVGRGQFGSRGWVGAAVRGKKVTRMDSVRVKKVFNLGKLC